MDAVQFAIGHKWVDGLAVLYCETAQTDPVDIAKSIYEAAQNAGVNNKPIVACFVGGEKSDKAMQWLLEHGIPAYGAPDIAMNAMAALHEFAVLKDNEHDGFKKYGDVNEKAARDIIAAARADGRDSLTEKRSKTGICSLWYGWLP